MCIRDRLKSVYAAAHITKTDAGLWQMVGVTPMLGVNDVADEIFDQTAATQLVAYATSQNLGMLAFWSLNRDVPGGAGITQTANQFTGIFLAYGDGSTAPHFKSMSVSGKNIVLSWQPSPGQTNVVQVSTNPVSYTHLVRLRRSRPDPGRGCGPERGDPNPHSNLANPANNNCLRLGFMFNSWPVNFLANLKARWRSSQEPEHLRRGKLGEAAAKKQLQKQGLKFLTANFRSARGCLLYTSRCV